MMTAAATLSKQDDRTCLWRSDEQNTGAMWFRAPHTCVLLLLILAAGCKTNNSVPVTTSLVEDSINVAPAAPLAQPAMAKASPKLGQELPPEWINTWIPIENWGRYNGLQPVRLVGANPHATYELQTASGALAFKVGSRTAKCYGLDWWLGFAPQMIQGVPCLHWLDAQKNLQPLLNRRGIVLNGKGTIVIDAGHGGVDSGTRSIFNNESEKNYTLDWAMRLGRLLTNSGWRVVLTRDRDTDVSLQQRVAIAERSNASLFVSLHFNSGGSNRALAGIETYCLTPVGMPSSLVRDYDDDVTLAFPNNAYDEKNLHLALSLHQNLVQRTAALDRGIRRARFMGVLRGQNRPAVLIEGGYLTNPIEAQAIAKDDYRQALASAVAFGLE
jgi:N-acetylmuramoyl-L-alanine amidase